MMKTGSKMWVHDRFDDAGPGIADDELHVARGCDARVIIALNRAIGLSRLDR
jgi:hypothetical protein